MNNYSYPSNPLSNPVSQPSSGQTVQQVNPVFQQAADVSPVVVRKSSKKWWIIGICTFLVVAVAAGFLCWFFLMRDTYSQDTPEDALEKFRTAYNRFDYAAMMESVDIGARQVLWTNMENAKNLMEVYDTVLGDELDKFRPQIKFDINNKTVETDSDGDKMAVFDINFSYEGGIYTADPRKIPEPTRIDLKLREVDGVWYLTEESYNLLTQM